MNENTYDVFHASCNRLVKGLLRGDLMLEARRSELAFRYVGRVSGPVIRENGQRYAAIVKKADWPTDIALLHEVKV